MTKFARILVGWYPGIRFAITGTKRQYRLYIWKRTPPWCRIPVEFQLRSESRQGYWVAYKTFPPRKKELR